MRAETVQGDQQQPEQDGAAPVMAATRVQRRWRAATAPSQAPVSQTAVAASAASTDLSPPTR